jgi:hypothetical protein
MARLTHAAVALVAAASLATASASSPTCALNGTACPPPPWAPQWNLSLSTIIQPSSSNYFAPSHTWGLISLDWR